MSEPSSPIASGDATVSSGALAIDAEPERLRFAPGSVIDGRFEVEAVLGRGGMGYVLAARHRDLDERVAIKLLLPHKADGAARERMLREAQNAAKIKSEHSVRIRDVVNSGPAAPYIVMELLRGESLSARLARGAPLEVSDVVAIVLQACEAIGEAHLVGIVHRDLKPSNLYLVDKPGHGTFVKVLDFGVSKRFETDSNHELTESRALLGSPVYAPPEQLRASRTVDRRADIWALGTVLYQALTQALPFRGDTLAEVCTRILQDAPPPPRTLRPDIPSSLELAILKCLEKRPDRRFGSIEELVLALRELAPAAAAKTLIYLDAVRSSSSPDLIDAPLDEVDAETSRTFSPSTLTGPSAALRPSLAGRRVAVAFPVAGVLVGLAVFLGLRLREPPERGPATRTAEDTPLAGAVSSAGREALPEPAEFREPPPGPSAGTTPNVPPTALSPAPATRRRQAVPKRAPRATAETRPWVDSR